MEEIISEITNWVKSTGIHPVNKNTISCDEIAQIDVESFISMPIEKIEQLMNKIVSYNIYVRSQKASLECQIEILTPEVNKQLYSAVSNLSEDCRFKKIEEKIAIVRNENKDIDDRYKDLIILKAKLARIKDIPYAIDRKIDILKMAYQRAICRQNIQTI